MADLLTGAWTAKTSFDGTEELILADNSGEYWNINPNNLANQIMSRFHPPRVSGRWGCPYEGMQGDQGTGLTAGRAFFIPFRLRYPETISQLGTVQMAGTTGNLALAIYSNSSSLPSGTSPLGYTSSIACSAAGAELAGAFSGGSALNGSSNLPLNPDVYWFAAMCSTTTIGFKIMAPGGTSGNGQNGLMATIFGSDSVDELGGSTNAHNGYYMTVTYGTWPDVTGASWSKITGSDNIRYTGPFWKVA